MISLIAWAGYIEISHRRFKETLINSLCGRIAIADMPRSACNLNIFLYMPQFLRSVHMSAKRQTLHIIYYFTAQTITQCFLKVFPLQLRPFTYS